MNWKRYVVEQYLNKDGEDYDQFKEEVKNKILEGLTSGEESEILSAAKILIHLDNLKLSQDELKLIEQKCKNMPRSERKMIRDYREDVKAAIMVLNNFDKGEKCKCNIYPNWIQFSPEREIEMGFLELKGQPVINKEKHQKEFNLKCLKCGTKWQSNEIHGYHYPWNEWIRK